MKKVMALIGVLLLGIGLISCNTSASESTSASGYDDGSVGGDKEHNHQPSE